MKSEIYTIEELVMVEKKFIENQEEVFTSRYKKTYLTMVLELIRQLKSWQDIRYCFDKHDPPGGLDDEREDKKS